MANTNRVSDTSSNGPNLGSISGVLNALSTAFSVSTTPVTALPPALIMTGANLRVGLTPSTIAARIISRQSEAGIPVGDVYNDGPNTAEAMWAIAIEEIINSILTEGRVDVVIPPGVAITSVGVGNLGIPVISQGATTAMGIGSGIIR